MHIFHNARRIVLTAALSATLAALRAVSRRLALSAEERRVLVDRVEATLLVPE